MTVSGDQDLRSRAMRRMQALIESDPQIAALRPLASVREAICAPGQSLADTMDRAFEGYADRPALGSRGYDVVVTDGKTERAYRQSYRTITYRDLQRRIHAVAAAWTNDPVHAVKPDDYVCIFGFTSEQLAILDFATAYVQAITVPLQVGAANIDFDAILDAIRPTTVAVTANDLTVIAELVAKKDYIKSVIVFDYDPRVDAERVALESAARLFGRDAGQTAMISLQDLEALVGPSEWKPLAPHPEGGDRIASIVHSSGSTGKPKPAMVTESSILFYWTSIPDQSPPVVSVALAPFSHLLGKGTLIFALKHGGTAYFTLAPDMSTLFDDIRLARPTFLGVFPRIIELVYQHYQNELGRERRSSGDGEDTVRERVQERMSAGYLGDRLCFALSGGSQIAPAVKTFFEGCFDVHLADAYGNTEGGNVAVDGLIQRPPVLEYRLRDVPELGYAASDKPHPRGEFCFRSAQSIVGFLDEPDATAKLFDADGFICTGDIVEELGPDQIRVIDRRNDVLKLSQGEFVPVGALGAIFEGNSDLIRQIYIYGNSRRSYLLAVAVPDIEAATAVLGVEPDEDALRPLIERELLRIASLKGVRSFEVPKGFLIEREPFSVENGLLSGLQKKVRPALDRKYGARLEAIYEAADRSRQEKRQALSGTQSGLSVKES